ncbi:MAG: RsiV family protein [Rudaea sp.]
MPTFFQPRQRAAALQGASVLAAALILTACSERAPPAAAVPAAVASAAPAAMPVDRQDVSEARNIDAKVHYPALRDELAPLDRAMHAYADAQRAALAARMDKTVPAAERREKPGRLDLDFTVATQTQDFVSALAEGEGDFGGAHPLPLRATFNQHLASGRILTLTDLFSDADAALKALSVEARRRLAPDLEARLHAENLADKLLQEREKNLRDLLEGGTEPKAEDFAAFLVDGVDGKAIGITLIFPAAQVASYADGPQQVAVPARVFYAQLKPEFRDAFAVDKEDMDAASRKPLATP